MRTRARLVTLAALMATSVTACSDDKSGSKDEPETATSFRRALDSFPATTELVRFVDRGVVAARLGVDGIDSLEDPADARAYARAETEAEWGRTEIGPFVAPMSKRGAFSELDVQWAARGVFTTEQGYDGWSILRLADSVDLGAVADAMVEAGYTESDLHGHRHLIAPATGRDGLVGGVYPAGALHDVTFVPEEQLLVTGAATPVLDVLTGRKNSLREAGTFDAVTQQVPAVEYAELRRGPAIDCAAPIVGTGSLTDAEVTVIEAALGLTGLRKPATSALYVVGGEAPRGATLLEHDDPASAREDADLRAAWLKAGLDVVTRLSNRDLYSVTSLVADENLVTVEWTYSGGLAPAVRAHQSGAGVGACAE